MTQFHISKEDKARSQDLGKKLDLLKGEVPQNLIELFKAVLRDPTSDTEVIVDTQKLPEYVTPNQAAIMLHASRPWIRKLMKDGKLRSHKVGAHFRINLEDVLNIKKTWDIERKEASKKLHSSINALLEESGWDDK